MKFFDFIAKLDEEWKPLPVDRMQRQIDRKKQQVRDWKQAGRPFEDEEGGRKMREAWGYKGIAAVKNLLGNLDGNKGPLERTAGRPNRGIWPGGKNNVAYDNQLDDIRREIDEVGAARKAGHDNVAGPLKNRLYERQMNLYGRAQALRNAARIDYNYHHYKTRDDIQRQIEYNKAFKMMKRTEAEERRAQRLDKQKAEMQGMLDVPRQRELEIRGEEDKKKSENARNRENLERIAGMSTEELGLGSPKDNEEDALVNQGIKDALKQAKNNARRDPKNQEQLRKRRKAAEAQHKKNVDRLNKDLEIESVPDMDPNQSTEEQMTDKYPSTARNQREMAQRLLDNTIEDPVGYATDLETYMYMNMGEALGQHLFDDQMLSDLQLGNYSDMDDGIEDILDIMSNVPRRDREDAVANDKYARRFERFLTHFHDDATLESYPNFPGREKFRRLQNMLTGLGLEGDPDYDEAPEFDDSYGDDMVEMFKFMRDIDAAGSAHWMKYYRPNTAKLNEEEGKKYLDHQREMQENRAGNMEMIREAAKNRTHPIFAAMMNGDFEWRDEDTWEALDPEGEFTRPTDGYGFGESTWDELVPGVKIGREMEEDYDDGRDERLANFIQDQSYFSDDLFDNDDRDGIDSEFDEDHLDSLKKAMLQYGINESDLTNVRGESNGFLNVLEDIISESYQDSWYDQGEDEMSEIRDNVEQKYIDEVYEMGKDIREQNYDTAFLPAQEEYENSFKPLFEFIGNSRMNPDLKSIMDNDESSIDDLAQQLKMNPKMFELLRKRVVDHMITTNYVQQQTGTGIGSQYNTRGTLVDDFIRKGDSGSRLKKNDGYFPRDYGRIHELMLEYGVDDWSELPGDLKFGDWLPAHMFDLKDEEVEEEEWRPMKDNKPELDRQDVQKLKDQGLVYKHFNIHDWLPEDQPEDLPDWVKNAEKPDDYAKTPEGGYSPYRYRSKGYYVDPNDAYNKEKWQKQPHNESQWELESEPTNTKAELTNRIKETMKQYLVHMLRTAGTEAETGDPAARTGDTARANLDALIQAPARAGKTFESFLNI